MHRNSACVFLSVCVISTMLYFAIWILSATFTDNIGRISSADGKPQENIIRILGWLTATPTRGYGRQGVNQCGQYRCSYTHRQEEYNQSDAIMISLRKATSVGLQALPRYRFPWQKWIAVETECPCKTWFQEDSSNVQDLSQYGLFNVTALPVLDADVQWWNRQREWTLNINKYYQLENASFVGKKSKMVAWFVSHCKTPSQRELFVKQLAKRVPVDIYGGCGPLKCGPRKIFHATKSEKGMANMCDHDLLHRKYKFYIAFENSLCEEYVTEKVMRLFDRKVDIIPIVAGHVNYERLLPPGSFIDVRDFKSIKQLAVYLEYLDRNSTAYNEYIRRKRATVPAKRKGSFCKLCQMLHKTMNKTTTVGDVVDFYGIQRRCVTPRRFYQGYVKDSLKFRDSFITVH